MNTIFDFKPFHFWAQPVLPLVYDDSLSYYETLCKLTDKVNEIIEGLNNENDTVFEELKQYLDQQLAVYEAKWTASQTAFVNQYTQDYQNFISEYHADYTAFIEKYLSDVQAIDATIKGQIAFLNQENKKYTDEKYDELLKMIEELQGTIGDMTVWNPFRGEYTTLNVAIQDVSALLRYFALTAFEYDDLNLTADEYDNLGLTAYEYDFLFKVMYKKEKETVYSPFTGEKVSYQRAIDELAAFHLQGYTATEYDSFGLSADGYDEKDLSASEYISTLWDAA